ncbi:MAG: hypothetical protein E7491_00135 [Ruminococcaceae bacterium]|nr:hypothetical protein [Oscillospiraceae bacterium]
MWWERFPIYSHISDRDRRNKLHSRIEHAYAGDPGWGPVAQCMNSINAVDTAKQYKADGVHPIAWMETFGTCFIYAMAYDKREDGTYETINLTPEQIKAIFGKDSQNKELYFAKPLYNAWSWEENIKKHVPNTVRWMGPHNIVNQEDIIGNTFTPENFGLKLPTYPDGTPAVGWTDTECYPLNAKFYDAVCSKDIYGVIDRFGESYDRPASCNTIDEKTGQPVCTTFGLYHHTVSENDRVYLPSKKVGERVHVAIMGVGKDPAAPFWGDYMKMSAKIHANAGMEGLWCDNMSPFNNFGFIPMQNGFGEWSVARFRDFIKKQFTKEELDAMGISDPDTFDVRKYLIDKARKMGAVDANRYLDRIWKDARWLEDDIWSAYKIHKAQMGREGIKRFYDSIKEGAKEAGCDEFCIMGNDIPWSLGWIQDDSVDMASTEVGPGWCYLGGAHGFGAPPYGKLAAHYRAALEHQSGPYATYWYYLGGLDYGRNPNITRVLMAEAFANHAFIKHGGNCIENDEVAVPWNEFLVANEDKYLGRKNYYDIGVWYSGSNQLQQVPPGHFTLTPDAQPHTFGYLGFVNALIDAHMPFRVVTDWKLTAESLAKFKTFIIPNAENIDDDVLPLLEQFVENGGRLVITGSSGTRYGQKNVFRRRESSLLDKLLGGKAKIESNFYMGKKGKIQIFVEDATDIRTLDDGSTEEETSVQREYEPVIIENKIGKGTVAFIQATVDMKYFLEDEKRDEMRPFILQLIGESDIVRDAEMPRTAAMSVWNKDNEAVYVDIHNYNIDIPSDEITATGALAFSVKLPDGKCLADFEVISPEADVKAEVECANGYAKVKVNSVEVFATVKLLLK